MFETLFQALFTYRPVVFQQGEFRFDVTGAVAGRGGAGGCRHGRRRSSPTGASARKGRLRDRIVLTALRMAALALVLFCLFRPTLVVRAAVPQQNVVAVLLDDSRSMQIPDWGGKARGEFVRQQFGVARQPADQGAVGAVPRPGVPVLVDGRTPRVRERPDVQRLADAARRRRSTARARSWPACRCRASCSCPTAPTRATRRSATRCSA